MVLLVLCASWSCGVFAEENDSLPTILLKEGPSKRITKAVLAPSPNKIDFTIMPLNCTVDDLINKVKYFLLRWLQHGNDLGSKKYFSYPKRRGQRKRIPSEPSSNDACPVKNEQLPGGTRGYLLNFSMWSLEDLQCVTFSSSFLLGTISTKIRCKLSSFPLVPLALYVCSLSSDSFCGAARKVIARRSVLRCLFSSLPPPVSSPPLMVVSCISSSEKPLKTAVPVTERTTEAVTVDPHTGAKQPKRLTEAQLRAHAIEYMRRVREKEAREEAEEAAGQY
uniref:Uncharacterized protein n=1 Tax=Ditylenchus dipsaci TaxID=166011 RepID=A0A915E313_9BILA